jgi:hypothetical protein
MIDRGELQAVRIGQRRVRIRRSSRDEFIAAGDKPAAQPDYEYAPTDTDADPDDWH